jgi:hypothetical protein
LLLVLDSEGEVLDSRGKNGEVKGDDEDDNEEGDLKENTGENDTNFFLNPGMGGVPRAYQGFV